MDDVTRDLTVAFILLIFRTIFLIPWFRKHPERISYYLPNALVSFGLIWTTFQAFDYYSDLFSFPYVIQLMIPTSVDIVSQLALQRIYRDAKKVADKFAHESFGQIATDEFVRSLIFVVLMFCIMAVLGFIFWVGVAFCNIFRDVCVEAFSP